MDWVAPDTRIADVKLGVPVDINIENGIAAMALAHLCGVTDQELKAAMETFSGVERRFDFRLKSDRLTVVSDYAHHPAEIDRSLRSLRRLYPERRLTALFQPHLYSRTRDFYTDFAKSLSLADEVILTEIYPAREEPIPGVSSRLIYDALRPGIRKDICLKEELSGLLAQRQVELLVVLGAGDLDARVPQLIKACLCGDE